MLHDLVITWVGLLFQDTLLIFFWGALLGYTSGVHFCLNLAAEHHLHFLLNGSQIDVTSENKRTNLKLTTEDLQSYSNFLFTPSNKYIVVILVQKFDFVIILSCFQRKTSPTHEWTRPGLVLGLRPDLNQKCTPEVYPRSKLTKCPKQQEEQQLK